MLANVCTDKIVTRDIVQLYTMHTAIAAFVLLFMSRQVFQRAKICMGHITFVNALTSPVEQWQLHLFIASIWHVTWQETVDV